MLAPSTELRSARNLKKITAGDLELNPRPRAIYVAVAGTMDIENDDGTTEEGIVVVAGSTIPCQIAKVTAVSSAVIYGYYN